MQAGSGWLTHKSDDEGGRDTSGEIREVKGAWLVFSEREVLAEGKEPRGKLRKGRREERSRWFTRWQEVEADPSSKGCWD